MKAIKDHVICRVDVLGRVAMDLALKFGISKEEADELVKDGNGYIEIFRIWLYQMEIPTTWETLINFLNDLKEFKLADELKSKLERKGAVNYLAIRS